jgi:hypothetical protein
MALVMAMISGAVRPLSLSHAAAALARNYGDKGAVVISFGDEGTRIGVGNLAPEELREALRIAMLCSFALENEAIKDPDDALW